MKIVFYSNRIKFSGDTLEKHGLGGSESALINVSSTWKKLFPEDEIIVYNGNEKRSKDNYDGVIYKTMTDFFSEVKTMNASAFISLREIFPFRLQFVDSKLKILWSQDDMNEGDLIKLKNENYTTNNIDLFFVISNHSKNDIQKSFPEKEILLQRNGYRSDWIEEFKEKKPIAIYASTPFRGLDVLSICWKRIYDGCINRGVTPTLRVCTGMSLYQQPEDNFRDLYNYLKLLPGVEFVGAVCQKELYSIMKECKVMTYSNHFLETGSMSVLEALANNLWVVTTDLGALGEQVHDGVNGFLIKGDAHSPEYQREFIEKSIDSLCEPLIPNSKGLIFSWEEQTKRMRNSILERI